MAGECVVCRFASESGLSGLVGFPAASSLLGFHERFDKPSKKHEVLGFPGHSLAVADGMKEEG